MSYSLLYSAVLYSLIQDRWGRFQTPSNTKVAGFHQVGVQDFVTRPDSLQFCRCVSCSVMDERVLWVFLVHQTVGTGLQTRDVFESHMQNVISIAGYKVTQVLVLLQLSPVTWRSPLMLISVSSIKENLCCNNAVVSTCITTVSHSSCMLSTSSRRCSRCSVERGRVVISAPDYSLCSVKWLWARNGTNWRGR